MDVNMGTMLPITVDDLVAIPRARATRVSYEWSNYGRYTVWIAEVSYFGWSIVTDYGKPGTEAVVTAPRTRDNCIAALADYVRNYGRGYGMQVEEWDLVSVKLDAWITSTQTRNLPWSPLPE